MGNYEKFQQLLDEYHSIKEKHDALFVKVTKKFANIAANISHTNPTDEELSEWKSLRKSLQEINKRMEEFTQKNI